MRVARTQAWTRESPSTLVFVTRAVTQASTEAWRHTVQFRIHRVLALSQPPLRPDETAVLRRAIDPVHPRYADVPPLLGAAALHWTMMPYRTPLQATTRLIAS